MAVGIVPALVVGLREGVEAALVVGIILAYLTKIGQRSLHRYAYLGVAAAIAASVVVAGAWAVAWGEFEGTQEQLFEGFAALLAVVVLTSMILWMMKAAKNIRKHVEQRIDTLVDRRQVLGLSLLAFIAVFREGVETVLFMAGLAGTATEADLVTGVGIGLLAAAFLGAGIYRASWKINLRRFFQGTGLFLIVIAAGLAALGVRGLQEAGLLPWLVGPTYDLSQLLPSGESNLVGNLLSGLIGYNDAPTQLEVVAYFTYWAFTILVYLGIRTGKIEAVTRPLKDLWVRRVRGRTPAADSKAP